MYETYGKKRSKIVLFYTRSGEAGRVTQRLVKGGRSSENGGASGARTRTRTRTAIQTAAAEFGIGETHTHDEESHCYRFGRSPDSNSSQDHHVITTSPRTPLQDRRK